jgi:hypothetical protein
MTEPQDKIYGRRRFGDGECIPTTTGAAVHVAHPAQKLAIAAFTGGGGGGSAAPPPPPPPHTPRPTSSAARKDIPLWTGALQYAPAAFALMAATSQKGNAKHNPGEPLHHARGKSADHQNCIARHMVDFDAMLAYRARFGVDSVPLSALEEELGNLMWRTALFVQEQAERLGIAPRAPRAVLPSETATIALEGR